MMSLQQNHLPRLYKITCLKSVEVDSAGERVSIPPGSLVSGFLLSLNQSLYPLSEDVVNFQPNVEVPGEGILDLRNPVEGVKIVLRECIPWKNRAARRFYPLGGQHMNDVCLARLYEPLRSSSTTTVTVVSPRLF